MLKYEFYYNAEYAKEHNPRLMHIGLSGGFGCIRAMMIKAVEGGDMVRAEQRFWSLMTQSLVEAKLEEDIIGVGTLDELLECWFDNIMDDDENELFHFIRPVTKDSIWTRFYALFKTKHYKERT